MLIRICSKITISTNIHNRLFLRLTSQKFVIENVIIIQQILEIAEEKQFLWPFMQILFVSIATFW